MSVLFSVASSLVPPLLSHGRGSIRICQPEDRSI